jgi:hypothetical protein
LGDESRAWVKASKLRFEKLLRPCLMAARLAWRSWARAAGVIADPQESARPRRGDRFSPRPILIAITILFLAKVVPELLAQWYNSDGTPNLDTGWFEFDLVLVQLLVLGVEAALLLFYLAVLRWRKVLSHASGATLLLASLVYAAPIFEAMEHAKFVVFRTEYDSCARRAVQYAENARFRVCNVREAWGSYAMIIYDSGGQIILDWGHQSEAFKNFLILRQSPVVVSCRVMWIVDLGENFYRMEFACQ